MSEVLVTGATSVVGRYLLPELMARGHRVIALSRQHAAGESVHWVRADIGAGELPALARTAGILIHLAPLPLLIPLLMHGGLVNLRQVVAIGTTSIFTKARSGSKKEQVMIENQRRAEQELAAMGECLRIHWTLFRPTLVYDGIHDKNIARIARFIRYLRFFPLPERAEGLRQPLHATDLALMCAVVADSIEGSGIYNLAGAEVLSYREMVQRIFIANGLQPRICSLPDWLYRCAFALLRLFPVYADVTAQIIERMNQDMVFDNSSAQAELGFSPRPFEPDSHNKRTRSTGA